MIEIICREDLPSEGQAASEESKWLPKNIRQIGSPRGRHKIYIEDYVYTYLKNMAREKESAAAVFLGNVQPGQDNRYTFVSGAVECGAAVFQWDKICLDDSFWDYIYKEKKQYFPELEIVGWFLAKSGQAMELTSIVESAHRRYFAGKDKILMLMDILEGEEVFFLYDQGYLKKREGYYIYYEKNIPMQEYMVSKREEEHKLGALTQSSRDSQPNTEFAKLWKELEQTEDEPPLQDGVGYGEQSHEDGQQEWGTLSQQNVQPGQERELSWKEWQEAVSMEPEAFEEEEMEKSPTSVKRGSAQQKEAPGRKDPASGIFTKDNQTEPKSQAEEALEAYRQMMIERHGRRLERQNRSFLYTASSFFLVMLCVLGITTINNYRKMQEVEETLHILSSPDGKEAEEKGQNEKETGPVVESISSQVTPLEEEGGQADPEDGEDSGKAKEKGDQKKEGKDQEKAKETSSRQDLVRYYTVQPGDTLDSICLSIYETLDMREELCKTNEILDGDKIFVGQKLMLP